MQHVIRVRSSLQPSPQPRRGDRQSPRSRGCWTRRMDEGGHPRGKATAMSRTDLNYRGHGEQARLAPRLEMVMPRLSHELMVAILREGGVPESDARRWV